ncbi:MAG: aminopeptidase [Candidatus Caldarchaeum sp.]
MKPTNELQELCLRVLDQCVAIGKGESCLLITDLRASSLSHALGKAVLVRGGVLSVLSLPKEVYTKEPLPRNVEAALTSSEVVVIHTRYLFPQQPRRLAAKAGARVLSLCAVTEDMALRALNVDYDKLSTITHKLAEMFACAQEIHIKSGNGKEFCAKIANQPVIYLDGVVRMPGQISALPAGVVATLPIPGSAQGRVVLNGSLTGFGLLDEPVVLEVKSGRVVRISGGKEAKKLERLLRNADEGAWHVAEIGLGTNPKAVYTGNLVEDERVLGSAHVGLGRNTHLGGMIKSSLHLDGTIRYPYVYLDGKLIACNGSLVL